MIIDNLAIAILTYNKPFEFKRLIESIFQNAFIVSNQVFVFDDSTIESEANSIENICTIYGIKYSKNHRNLGLDKNFKKSFNELKNSFKYVWYIGHDDKIEKFDHRLIVNALKSEPDIVQLNYSIQTPDNQNLKSFWYSPRDTQISTNDLSEYLDIVGTAGTFISSIIRKTDSAKLEDWATNWSDFCSYVKEDLRAVILSEVIVANIGQSFENPWNQGYGTIKAQLDLILWFTENPNLSAKSKKTFVRMLKPYFLKKVIAYRALRDGKNNEINKSDLDFINKIYPKDLAVFIAIHTPVSYFKFLRYTAFVRPIKALIWRYMR